ncbi:ADP-ribosyltransferase [Vibrio sp. 99-70-13A1]|uniref:ADP-ribosyltransferase n=1 Tax=Vibrio sp. 99-70-13A1 TaxID=2607601 RepID=UPI001493BCEE|nr:ADP-ribosyltransferase [Vibrio sp. 99-70-13A1]NOH99390.1 hypothetical protein [Vibrio sp. 99-70-13A1]
MTIYEYLSTVEQEAFDAYKRSDGAGGGFAYTVNHNLRNAIALTAEDEVHKNSLDIAINSQSLLADTCLYRAVYGDCVERFIKSQDFQDPAYLSTSAQDDNLRQHYNRHPNSDGYDPYLLIIDAKQSAKAMYMEKSDNTAEEKEYLLPRNAKLTIVKREEITDKAEIKRITGDFKNEIDVLKVIYLEYS